MGTDQIDEILCLVRNHLTQVQRQVKLIDAELGRLMRVLAEIEVPPLPHRRTTPEGDRPRRGRER
jgi:hypothetical protein